MNITREQLAKALDHLWVFADNREGTHHGQIVNAGPVSHDLWENLLARDRPEAGDAKPEPVVDASICCDHEHLPDDRELALMAAILRGMRWLDKDARHRIRQWVDERFANTPPPF